MKEYIVDTNVPLVANGDSDMTNECMAACIQFLQGFNNNQYLLVIDDRFRILGVYLFRGVTGNLPTQNGLKWNFLNFPVHRIYLCFPAPLFGMIK
jgi:hypothetical protein